MTYDAVPTVTVNLPAAAAPWFFTVKKYRRSG